MSKARDNADLINNFSAITATASEINILEGATLTTAELNRVIEVSATEPSSPSLNDLWVAI
jgi:hypothetical protein